MTAFEKKRKPRGKPFEKGNKIGHRFAPGESGNPGGRPKLDYSPTHILEELARIAFLDPRDFYDADGNLIPPHELDEDVARALGGLDSDELFEGRGEDRECVGVTKKIKFIQKTQALELLGKYHKLFTDRVEHTGTVTHEHIDLSKLSDEQIGEVERLIESAAVTGNASR